MISSLDELIDARQAVYHCMADLERDNLSYHPKPQIGVLVELPSAVAIIDALAAEADFLSIGTNDFIQYLLAVDRTNEIVAGYFKPFHPAVLRSLAKIVSAARSRNKEISVCGELAHDFSYIPFLLGIGIRILSMYPKFLPAVQKVVWKLRLSDARLYAEQLLAQDSLKAIRAVRQHFTRTFGFNDRELEVEYDPG